MSAGETIRPFFFNPAHLDSLAERHAAAYRSAEPFPHAVLDDFLPDWVITAVLAEFPSPEEPRWHRYKGSAEVKLELTEGTGLGPFTRHVLAQFNSAEFAAFLEKLTGIDGIVPDPYFVGGGLHQVESGGYLSVHADFNEHPHLHLDRRLNVLVYLNRGWTEADGGHLELWDRDMTQAARRVLPIANRCVVFSTTSFSFHGYPDPLRCPPEVTRKSMAFYYYSNGRPTGEISSTSHSTLFRSRPHHRSERVRVLAARVVPPVLADVLRPRMNRRPRLDQDP